MTQDLTTTNIWLAILALVSLSEFLLVLVAAVVGYRLYRRALVTIDHVERAYLPLAHRFEGVVNDAQDVVHRVHRLEETAHKLITRVEDVTSGIANVAQSAWPVLGTWRAVAAAVGSWRNRDAASSIRDVVNAER